LTDTELVYCNFRIAFENIFQYEGEEIIYEGERVMANRGAQQFVKLVENWRTFARINF
jgi:hypothetical protein